MQDTLFISGKLRFFREPYLVPPPFLSFLNLCKQLWLPSSPGMTEHCHPHTLPQDYKASQWKGALDFSCMAQSMGEVWVYKFGGGQGEVGRTHCPLKLDKNGQAQDLESAAFGKLGDFQIKCCLLMVKKKPDHHSGGSIKEALLKKQIIDWIFKEVRFV